MLHHLDVCRYPDGMKVHTPEKSKPRKRLSPEERRQQLLQVAIDLFAEKGFGEAKHADIAKRVGISTAATFVYFPTREALLEAVADEVGQYYLALFENIAAEGDSARAVLGSLASRVLDAVSTDPNYVKVQLAWASRFDPFMRKKYRAFDDAVLSSVSAILWASEDNISTENRDDARILISASQTLALMKLDGEPTEKLERFTQHTIDVVLAFRRDQ